ncbi:unnamed protein product [Ceutorhynchus assimilis]|uniref:Uncharacterized protein n=1 Tax=Ceutorhynchus assimilis TaxID=467358 RepID=A0A9N9MA54_9CUCU|nr:unnamed protein product [Ceutorhynchus assimilis]
MQFLVFLSAAVAFASATYLGPIHIPVIGPNGVPVEPHEVQAARANHLAAVASAHKGPYTAFGVPSLAHNALPLDTPEVASAKLQHYQDFAVAAQRNGVHVPLISATTRLAGPLPVDTPEVQHAKAAHFHAYAEAAARGGPSSYLGHYRRRRDIYGGYHVPVIGHNGVPVDTPEVQAARANHLAALAQASARAGPASHYENIGSPYEAGAYEPYRRYYGPQATIGPNGQPLETPEVQAAKAYHLAAHAALRSGGQAGHYY